MSDCTDITNYPDYGLGLQEDYDHENPATCVTWDYLTTLRNDYNNSIYTKMTRCGYTNDTLWPKIGASPHFEEVNPLPTVTGYFRLTISNDGEACTVEKTEFIVESGTLLDLLSNPDYTYIPTSSSDSSSATFPRWNFYFYLNDSCNGCTAFLPTSYTDADMTLECPGGIDFPLYTGLKAISIGSCPGVCGVNVDWGGDGLTKLQEYVHKFGCVIAPDQECNQPKLVCCDGYYAIGHYTATGDGDNEHLVLTTIDIGVGNDGGGQFQGYLTTVILAAELNDIKTNIVNALPFFTSNGQVIDPCGPDTINGSQKGFNCDIINYSTLASSNYVQNNPTACTGCTEDFSGTICACPWQEMDNILAWLNSNGCVMGCNGGSCCSTPCALYPTTAICCGLPSELQLHLYNGHGMEDIFLNGGPTYTGLDDCGNPVTVSVLGSNWVTTYYMYQVSTCTFINTVTVNNPGLITQGAGSGGGAIGISDFFPSGIAVNVVQACTRSWGPLPPTCTDSPPIPYIYRTSLCNWQADCGVLVHWRVVDPPECNCCYPTGAQEPPPYYEGYYLSLDYADSVSTYTSNSSYPSTPGWVLTMTLIDGCTSYNIDICYLYLQGSQASPLGTYTDGIASIVNLS